jgi:hypothetical protein
MATLKGFATVRKQMATAVRDSWSKHYGYHRSADAFLIGNGQWMFDVSFLDEPDRDQLHADLLASTDGHVEIPPEMLRRSFDGDSFVVIDSQVLVDRGGELVAVFRPLGAKGDASKTCLVCVRQTLVHIVQRLYANSHVTYKGTCRDDAPPFLTAYVNGGGVAAIVGEDDVGIYLAHVALHL